MDDEITPCPLCGRVPPATVGGLRGADGRLYSHCRECWLIFGDPADRLSPELAAAHYRTHENRLENAGYVAFLRRAVDRLLPHLDSTMRGLDFGCGPGPTLSELVRRAGISCEDYDSLFVTRELNPPYDFIFATECFEHFDEPGGEIARIAELLHPGGYLCVMTECWTDLERFGTWYYTRDPTHVVYFHARTFSYICQAFGFEALPSDDRRVWLLRKDEE